MNGKSGEESFDKSGVLALVLVLSVSLILVVPTGISPTFASAGEDGETVEAPEWYEGDTWEYEIKETIAPEITMFTEVEKEVIDEKNYEIDIVEGEKEDYPSYVVEERHVRETEGDAEEIEEGEIKGSFGYTMDTLSPITTQPYGDVLGVYYPPLRELDFPFSLGDNWTYEGDEAGYFLEEQPGDTPLEPARNIIQYQGRVEEKVTRDVSGNSVDTYMINFTVLAEDLETGEVQWRRQEIYFSPEVKNVVHREMYETRLIDEDEAPDDPFPHEEGTGNETLVDYEVQEYEPENGDGDESLLGVGIIILMIGVGTATLYIHKKVKGT